MGDCGVLPAGSRLLKGQPWPIVRFVFDTEEEAREAAEKVEMFNAPDWKPRRWAWVDPEKDINAQIKAVENHFKSKRQVISEGGGDIEDVFKDIKKDEELAEDVGLEKPSESVD